MTEPPSTETVARRRRLSAVQEIARRQVENVPDPEELARQLDRKYELPGRPRRARR